MQISRSVPPARLYFAMLITSISIFLRILQTATERNISADLFFGRELCNILLLHTIIASVQPLPYNKRRHLSMTLTGAYHCVLLVLMAKVGIICT